MFLLAIHLGCSVPFLFQLTTVGFSFEKELELGGVCQQDDHVFAFL